VTYSVDGFLEKNRDTVLEEQLKVLKSSEVSLKSSSEKTGYPRPDYLHLIKSICLFKQPSNEQNTDIKELNN